MHPQPLRSSERAGRFQTADALKPVDVRLPARASELKSARDRVAAAGAEFGLDPKSCYEFVFAVNEAVTNAIKHGTADEAGTVGLSIEVDGDALLCTVTDSGPFTHRDAAPDPTSAESGRGFMFMTALTDEFELVIEPEVTIVRLRKYRPVAVLVTSA
jgi:anti-sigma regulatory factor (Ser/Thr protein kinase)